MGLVDLDLRIKYDSLEDNLITDFYHPALAESNNYDRITGFFSSSSLAIAARGLEKFIGNRGKMRMITCPILSKDDVEAISNNLVKIDDAMRANFWQGYNSITDAFQQDHVKALGWMLANGLLEIKIAVIRGENGRLCDENLINKHPIFHQKIGILYDNAGYALSFSGSINESASGWLDNVEEFKLFKSWVPGQADYFKSDASKFNKYWSGLKGERMEILELPDALKNDLIQIGKDFDVERFKVESYVKKEPIVRKKSLSLFTYQEAAVKMWIENNFSLMLEMATGTGKTRTALGCIQEAAKSNSRILVVITCPQNTLSRQWQHEAEQFDLKIDKGALIDGTVTGWRLELQNIVSKFNSGVINSIIIYTSHQTCSEDDFIDQIRKIKGSAIKFLVGDEAHGLGAGKTRLGLSDAYQYRLGLSATPRRWFDEEGTEMLYGYFGDKSYVFSIQDALREINPLTGKHYLVDYDYYPRFVSLTDDELEGYQKLTTSLVKSLSGKDKSDDQIKNYERLLFLRANIEKNAENKYDMLKEILNTVIDDINYTIIFVSDEQIDTVLKILHDRGIDAHRFTQSEGTVPEKRYNGLSERQMLIRKFQERELQALVAIKCLDEGIDIPSAKRAIVMASSTNPREYIQRIGRVIRQSPEKNKAEIYDLIIRPDINRIYNSTAKQTEKKILLKELERVAELSANSFNSVDILRSISSIKEELI